MSESLNAIALISGGKDSFFSLLHCLQNGHKIIALGNLYPAPKSSTPANSANEEEEDLNSFMYQTVGHQVIPLYSEALGLPLYRQEIRGTAVVTGLTYSQPEGNGMQNGEDEQEETESLIPLLKRIMDAHPEANALSTGAILSTYQRTRIESIALRLGLTPLSYLWQYPYLPGHSDITLLQDMSTIGLDARIIKVASGGLDESFLWENVASTRGMTRLDKAAKRFGVGGGAVMGEGGEYETLVLDGPDEVFKGRIVVEDGDREVVREGGGAAWLRIKRATVVMKVESPKAFQLVQPKLLEPQFSKIFEDLKSDGFSKVEQVSEEASRPAILQKTGVKQIQANQRNIGKGPVHWTFNLQSCIADGSLSSSEATLEEEISGIVSNIRKHLDRASLDPRDIMFAVILLRSMEDFGAINKIYGTLFPSPNPPARVTVACGDVLPGNSRVIINLTLFNPESLHDISTIAKNDGAAEEEVTEQGDGIQIENELSRKSEALHVQSRSYWAPANIGPYSQAISIPTSPKSDTRNVYIAGQIPLIPATMTLPETQSNAHNNFSLQATLSLQHLWQIGREMDISWYTGAIAFLSKDHISAIKHKSFQAGKVWTQIHPQGIDDEDEDQDVERDLWEEKFHFDLQIRGTNQSIKRFPDTGLVESPEGVLVKYVPPCFAAEVEALPRGSEIEWQAILGLSGGEVFRPSSRYVPNLGTVHQFRSGGSDDDDEISHFIIAIPAECSESCQESLLDWQRSLASRPVAQAAYLDAFACGKGMWGLDLIDGVVPCRSLWGGEGRRLVAVVVYME